MRTTIITLLFIFIGVCALQAQELKKPLAPKVIEEVVPPSPGEEWTWVAAHWEWQANQYVWVEGNYIQVKEGHMWVDGEWERNQKTGWWVYNEGYWQKTSSNSVFFINKSDLSDNTNITFNSKE